MISQAISHFRITKKIGEGGMGEVYLAQDTRLERTVALKLISAVAGSDPQLMHRFMQEARAVSALNHPNICVIHEVGETEDGRPFIAMEYVEGVTLSAKIDNEAMDAAEIIETGIQLADALDEAHSKGIIHRDIKPSNIMITPRGQVKVLDFGLAKVIKPAGEVLVDETDTQVRTESGLTMGTLRYMSPEQALGEGIDRRSDLFSLGALLYEMATGVPAFRGLTPAIIFDGILNRSPSPVTVLNPALPIELEQVINKALEKDPEMRYRSASDIRADLMRLRRDLDSGRTIALSRTTVPLYQEAPRRSRLLWISALVVLAVVAAVSYYLFRVFSERTSVPARPVPFTSYPGQETEPAFSPDGNQIAFAWNGEKGDNLDVYVKLIGTEKPLPLTTNPGSDFSPAWSPDGRSIAFIRTAEGEQGIFKVPALGGPEQKLTTLNSGIRHLGLDWSPDGKYLAFADKSSRDAADLHSIYLLSLDDLQKHKLTNPPPEALGDHRPAFSPDGRTLAFVRYTRNETDIYVIAVEGGEARRLTFDNRKIEGISWMPDGRHIVFSSNRAGSFNLWKIQSSGGKPERVSVEDNDAVFPAISRQGNRLAYMQVIEDTNIWRVELSTSMPQASSPTKLVASTRRDNNPQFSPDVKKIAFESDRSGSYELWTCNSDGSNPVQVTSLSNPYTGNPSWSPDGRQIAFDTRPEGHRDIFVINVEGGLPRRLTTESSSDVMPSWSRDGKWIYFASDRSGAWQVWKVPAEGGDAVQVTKGGGYTALESLDGHLIYYAKFGSPGMWMIPAEGGEEVQLVDLPRLGYWRRWALSGEGIYFLDRKANSDTTIEFFSFATRGLTQIGALDKNRQYRNSLAVSPDDRWILYTQVDYSNRDIMLVENFR